jgi:glycosyltransferase involved in cell wall biosynthesis
MRYHLFLDTGELGGGNLFGLAVAERLRDSACDATVWPGGAGPVAAECDRRGLRHEPFDQLRLRAGGAKGTLELARLWRRLRQRTELVHVTSTLVYGLLARGLRWSAARTVGHVQIENTPDDYRWAYKHPPHAIVTCADFLVKQVEAALPAETLRRTRVLAIPNAVDVTRFFPGDRAEAKRVVQAPTDRPLVLMAANLSPHKGQQTAILAVKMLRDVGTDAELWLAGVERGGVSTFTESMKQLVAEHGLGERVRFLGQRSDMPELLRAADAVVLPSTHEGLPISLLEAQASGAPVLAAPTAGVPEVVIDEQTGFLIAADDPSGYARRLHELFRDPAGANKLTAAALDRIRQRYTWDVLFRDLRAVYDEIGK